MEDQSLSNDQQIVTMESYARMLFTYTEHNEVNVRFRTVCQCETCTLVRTIATDDIMRKDLNFRAFKYFFEIGGSMDAYLAMVRKAQSAVENGVDTMSAIRDIFRTGMDGMDGQ